MNILIRDLNKKTENQIEFLKKEFHEKTASKVVIKSIDKLMDLIMITKKKDAEILNLRSRLTKLENFEECIQNSITELNNDEESDFY